MDKKNGSLSGGPFLLLFVLVKVNIYYLISNNYWLITIGYYSYCPDLRCATSASVRKRHAPRLRFFFVRPA